ncbi:hypothetical protein HQ560_10065 [bacterium]|nr:hypothetical protein [bacterium]
MKDTSNENGRKKGFWAAIWESMTKTGGCCGSGESCCGPARPDAEKKQTEEEPSARTPDATGTRRS